MIRKVYDIRSTVHLYSITGAPRNLAKRTLLVGVGDTTPTFERPCTDLADTIGDSLGDHVVFYWVRSLPRNGERHYSI